MNKQASAIQQTRVLIVESRASAAADLQQTLENLGYTVLAVASSGEAAIQKAAEPRPDLVLTDVVLEAELDGIKAAAQIRNRFDIPVIFVTSQADDEVLRQASVIGPFGYILKPFDARQLHINIQMALYRHKMESKLRESVENFRTLAENANDGILISTGKRGTHVYANARAAEITGYSVAELLQTDIKDLVHPDQAQNILQRYTQRLEGRSVPRQYETCIIRKDGQGAYVELTASKTVWQGQPADIVILRDITERKRTEEKTRQHAAQLEALLKVGLEITAQLDLDTLLQSIVSQAVKLLKGATGCFSIYRPGQDLLERVASAGDHPPSIGAIMRRGQGIPGYILEDREPLIVNDLQGWWEGRGFIIENCPTTAVVGMPVKWGDEFLGVLNVRSLDNSQRTFSPSDGELLNLFATQAAIAIKNARLYEQARRDAETRATLLREVNHRVKNNLMSIIGLFYNARSQVRTQDQATYQTTLDILIGRVRGLAAVHSMLSASQWTSLRLSDLATEIIQATLHALPREKHTAVDVHPSPVRVTPDQAHNLALVINELTTNALKYALVERDRARITFQVVSDDDVVRCEFRDDGPGYPEDVLRLERYNLGLELLQTIVRDGLDRELTLRNEQGAVALITFKP
jgi:PAS domain S-box-containing protein